MKIALNIILIDNFRIDKWADFMYNFMPYRFEMLGDLIFTIFMPNFLIDIKLVDIVSKIQVKN